MTDTPRHTAALTLIVFGCAFGLMSLVAIAHDIGTLVGRLTQ